VQEHMELVLQNHQQCAELMQLCIARTKVLTLLPSTLRLSIALRPSIEEEVETLSENLIDSGFPLQTREPIDASPSSADLAQWPATHLFGLIRASINQLEKRLQHVEKSSKYARDEALLAQACMTQEAYEKI
jgi:hypothetical protein